MEDRPSKAFLGLMILVDADRSAPSDGIRAEVICVTFIFDAVGEIAARLASAIFVIASRKRAIWVTAVALIYMLAAPIGRRPAWRATSFRRIPEIVHRRCVRSLASR